MSRISGRLPYSGYTPDHSTACPVVSASSKAATMASYSSSAAGVHREAKAMCAQLVADVRTLRFRYVRVARTGRPI
jgi:hypothetical protein